MQIRYYYPTTGRFISPDRIEYADPETIDGLNLYAYCFNNPVMNVDPTGEFFWLILAAVLLFTPVGGISRGMWYFAVSNHFGPFGYFF